MAASSCGSCAPIGMCMTDEELRTDLHTAIAAAVGTIAALVLVVAVLWGLLLLAP